MKPNIKTLKCRCAYLLYSAILLIINRLCNTPQWHGKALVLKSIKSLDKFLSFAPPLLGEEEILELNDTIRSAWLTTGPKTEKFEMTLAAYLDCRRPIAVNSCTSALHLGLNILDVGPGQGVITTPLTFASSAHAIMYQKARPYFVDIEDNFANLCPKEIRLFLENECQKDCDGRPRHKKTGDLITTLLPVHYGGHPVDLDEFWSIACEYRLNILQDCAHAIGAYYKGSPIGSNNLKPKEAYDLKNLCAFSFYATKNITTGEGGCLTVDDEALAERARVMSMYGISDSRRIWGRYAPKGTWVYDVADLGFKYNMMDIQAALGLQQLKKLPEFIKRRAAHAATYTQTLMEFDQVLSLPKTSPNVEHAWHLYPLRLNTSAIKINRDYFIEILRDKNIGTSVLFIPLHFHSFYKKELPYKEGDFPKAEAFFRNLINLPISPAHSSKSIQKAAEIIGAIIKKHQ